MSLSDHLVAAWFSPGLTPLSIAARSGCARVPRRDHRPPRALSSSACCRSIACRCRSSSSATSPSAAAARRRSTIALASELARRGWHPGIVSRGYRATSRAPRAVGVDDDADVVGDEPLLLARTGLPVWIGADRPAAARALLAAHPDRDVIIADDGLAALRARTRRRNRGDRREPRPRQRPAAAGGPVARTGGAPGGGRRHRAPWRDGVTPRREFAMTLTGERFVRVGDSAISTDAALFRSRSTCTRSPASATPSRFFAQLARWASTRTAIRFPIIIATSPPTSRCPAPRRS